MKKDILRSSFFRVLEIVIVTLVSLALTPYLITHLGDKNYGLWLLILSTLGWFDFIDLGFSSAVKREIAFAIEKKNMQRINVVFSVSVVLFGALGIIAASGIIAIALFPEMIGVSQDSREIASVALCLLALKVLFDFIMNSFHGFFSAYIRMDIDANLSLLNTLIKSVLVFILIKDMNIYGAVLATLGADAVTQSLKMYFARRLNNGFTFSMSFVTKKEIHQLFSYSKHVIAGGIARTIQKRSDPLIVSHFLGLKYVALFGVVITLVNQIESVVKACVGVFSPVLNRLVARDDQVEGIFKQIVSINLFIAICLFTPLVILSEDFIRLWIGEDYAEYADLTILLGFAFLSRAVSDPIIGILMAQGSHKTISLVSLLGAIINITLSIVLVSYLGLYGIALATTLSFFISDVILHIYVLKQHNNFNLKFTIARIAAMFVSYSIFIFLGKFILNSISPLSWFGLLIAAATSFSFVFALSLFILIPQPLRQSAFESIKSKIKSP